MVAIFQGETGGSLSYQIPEYISLSISGYIDAVSIYRKVYRFDGIVSSGILYVPKLGLSNLSPGEYTLLPQVIDSNDLLYFIEPEDLRIVEVPDFFSNAVLIPADSILVRLANLESNQGILNAVAGASGVQTSRLLALIDNNIVEHADCTNIQHAGSIVGISQSSASPGDSVTIKSFGLVSSQLLNFVSIGPAVVGHNGSISTIIPSDAVFIEFVGTILDTNKIDLAIDTIAIMI